MALPEPKSPIKHFAIMDSFGTADGDLGAKRDALWAAGRLGLHGVLSGAPAWLAEEELGYTLCTAGDEVGNFEWDPFDSLLKDGGNVTLWAEQNAAKGPLAAGCAKADVTAAGPLDDEPGFSVPRDFPPLSNPNYTDVKARWHSYLREKNLTLAQLGASSWEAVLPSTAGAAAGSSLEAKRLYYWSLRYVSWEGSRFLGNATRALEAALTPAAQFFVNWNNMAGHWYYPGVNGTGQLNHDWFEHARERGTTTLWTEVRHIRW